MDTKRCAACDGFGGTYSGTGDSVNYAAHEIGECRWCGGSGEVVVEPDEALPHDLARTEPLPAMTMRDLVRS